MPRRPKQPATAIQQPLLDGDGVKVPSIRMVQHRMAPAALLVDERCTVWPWRSSEG